MHDPVAAGRRVALRATAYGAAAAVAAACVFLVQGPAHAWAACWGGAAMAAGNASAAWLALDGIVPARVALGRLVLGTLAKWLVVVAFVATGLALWRLPALPLLAGLALGWAMYLLMLNPGSRVKRER